MPDKNVNTGIKNVYYSTDGVNWTPLGKVVSFEIAPDDDTPTPKFDNWADSLEMEMLYFKRRDFKRLRKLLGYTRLDHVWAYRLERKGHPRCR